MEIRLFQWLVPLVVFVFLLSNLLRYYRGRIDLRETIFVSILWIGIALIAIFPDFTSNCWDSRATPTLSCFWGWGYCSISSTGSIVSKSNIGATSQSLLAALP